MLLCWCPSVLGMIHGRRTGLKQVTAEGILKRCKEQRGVLVAVGGGIEQQAGEVAAHPALRERVPGDAADEAAYAVRVREYEAVLFREIGMAQQQCVKPLGALRRVAHGLRPGGVP